MNKKLSAKTKWGYGVGLAGESLSINTFAIYFMVFLTNAVGVSPAFAGLIVTVTNLISAVMTLVVGNLTDRSTNPNGRRRPAMIKALIPSGILMYLIFASPMGNNGYYYLIVSSLFFIIFPFVMVPYQILGGEITDDYQERTSVKAISNLFNYAAMIIASGGVMYIVSGLSKDGTIGDLSAWGKMGLILAIGMVICYGISIIATKGHDTVYQPQEGEKKISIVATIKDMLKMRAFRQLLAFYVLAYLGIMLFTGAYVYYFTFNLGYPESLQSLLMTVYCIMVMVASLIFDKVAVDKKKITIIAGIVYGVIMVVCGLMGKINMVMVLIVYAAIAFEISTQFIHCTAMLFDIADVDAFKSGEPRTGTILSSFSTVAALIGAVSGSLLGLILSVGGYDGAAAVQSASALNAISFAVYILPGAMTLLGVLFLLKFPINAKNHALLIEAMEKKNAGEPYSTEGFEELLK